MQGSNVLTRRAGLLALLAVLFLATTMFQIAPTQAQTQPTATPSDPLWNAFSNTRDALEDKFNVDLTIVQSWQFTETEFTDGIDSCIEMEDPSQARQLYYGWRFIITSLDGRQFEGRSSFNYQIITACDKVTEPISTGSSTAATGDLPAPVAGSAAIGGFELGGQVLELNANTVNLAKRSGMTWVKTQLTFTLGQDPSTAAGFINAAHANGFKALLSIKGDKSQLGDYGSYISSFSSFLGGVAALGVDAIE
ncbi:MAG: hypothetical protein IT319_09115, partial [Anaerolineae bacterium]|nr:hypothetical protein [Anaerolineae bacterium]